MGIESVGITDITDITEIPYNPYTHAHARKDLYGKSVRSVISVIRGHAARAGAAA